MDRKFFPRLSIEASAGSGKTYQLAQRYINLLSFYIRKNSTTDILLPDKISSIIAITFTNKAAAEMKERILLFLKNLSYIYSDDKIIDKKSFSINSKEALSLIVDIIKNQSDFNVTTIDSFMNKILKAFSIELGILPDYDITFNREEIFDLTVNELISDPDNHKELFLFLKHLLSLDYKGINGELIIKRGIEKFKDIVIPDNIITSQEFLNKFNLPHNIFSAKKLIEDKISFYANKIDELLEANKEIFNGNRIKPFKNLDIKKITDKIDKIKEFDISKLYKKNRELNKDDIIKFENSLKEILNLYSIYILLKHIIEVEAVVIQLKRFKQKEQEIKSLLNIVDGGVIAKEVGNILQSNNGVSYAFCKLGEKISHYLIDEFQDTSYTQFNAIYKLVENALSEGGSIFIVGDKKQAIYAWRGGDYNIFEEIINKKELKIVEKKILKNYRSKKNIVKFNNKIFSITSLLNEKIKSLFQKYDPFLSKILIEDIRKVYANAVQEIVHKEGGYVQVHLKKKDIFIEEFIKEKLISILNLLLFEKKVAPSNILILLRYKKEIDIVVSWIKDELPDINIITEDSLKLLTNFEIKKFLLILLTIIYNEDTVYKKALEEVGINFEQIEELINKIEFLSPYEVACAILEKNILNLDDNKIYFERLLEEILVLSNQQKTLEEIVEYLYKNEDITVTFPEDINAIKIMTIHKSKGLESHTVIIPFYNWNLYSYKNIEIYNSYNIANITGEDEFIFAKVDKELRGIIKEAKEEYFEKIKINFLEALNLMYVANTRAKENLFIIGNFANFSKMINASELLAYILFNETDKDELFFEIGEIKENLKKEEKPKNISVEYKINSSIRDYLKIYPELNMDIENMEQKNFGELFHITMSLLGKFSLEDNVNEIIYKSYNKAVNILNYKNEKILQYVKNTVNDLYEYFYNIDYFWNEKEVVNKKGEIFRIDRIVSKENKLFIIDYKTGEFKNSHILQVKNYMKFLPGCYGIIYYVKSGVIKSVN